MAYNDARVTIVGTHAGCGVGPDGYTQMALEDVALLRSLPNMTVLAAGRRHRDRADGGAPGQRAQGPGLPAAHPTEGAAGPRRGLPLQAGKLDLLREGKDLTICATGATVRGALEAAARLADEGIEAAVVNVPIAQAPGRRRASRELAAASAHGDDRRGPRLVGGLGSAVCEALAEIRPHARPSRGAARVRRVGQHRGPLRQAPPRRPGIYAEAKGFVAA